MKKILLLLLSVFSISMFALAPATAQAANCDNAADKSSPACQVKDGSDATGGKGQQLQPKLKTIVNIMLFVLGAVAVIMIVIGGIRYTLSNGDASQISGAKNTILYSVIGLIVALLAYAIVNFVLGAF
jgi:hypothetical protein